MKLVVKDMNCGHCVKSITNAIKAIDNAAVVETNLDTKEVEINGKLTQEQAVQAITDAGFTVS